MPHDVRGKTDGRCARRFRHTPGICPCHSTESAAGWWRGSTRLKSSLFEFWASGKRGRGPGERSCMTTVGLKWYKCSRDHRQNAGWPRFLQPTLPVGVSMISMPLESRGTMGVQRLDAPPDASGGWTQHAGAGLTRCRACSKIRKPSAWVRKSCIFIVLGGGPTHVDTWDLNRRRRQKSAPVQADCHCGSRRTHQRAAAAPGQIEPALHAHPVDDARHAYPKPPGRDA